MSLYLKLYMIVDRVCGELLKNQYQRVFFLVPIIKLVELSWKKAQLGLYDRNQ
jgi:hypothetical protein